MNGLEHSNARCVQWKGEQLPVKLLVKMECENHPTVSGNKWWKLKYNLEAATETRLPILTFGGAYSNHIYATSAAAREMRLPSIGVIRGERISNPVLTFAMQNGMTLEFVSREAYKNKMDQTFLAGLRQKYGDFYLLPEGGTNEAAIRGCKEWGELLERENDFDVLCLAVGTGGTMAGLVSGMSRSKSVVGFSSLKGGEFLEGEVARWLSKETCAWRIETGYHFGGYGKRNSELLEFIEKTREYQGIALDPVYTAKAMFGVIDLVRKGTISAGSTILFLHTGGLHTFETES